MNRRSRSKNIPLTKGTPEDLWQKMLDEVQLGRFAGPFRQIPFDSFSQSPVGLVPKSNGKLRLIFHLSYEFGEEEHSLNYFTPDEWCTVSYQDLDHTIRNCLHMLDSISQSEQLEGLFATKTDLLSTFRVLPLKSHQFCLLIMQATNPKTREIAYFVDKCLPFRASISCALFHKFSDALMHITETLLNRKRAITNYLDDFLFIWLLSLAVTSWW